MNKDVLLKAGDGLYEVLQALLAELADAEGTVSMLIGMQIVGAKEAWNKAKKQI